MFTASFGHANLLPGIHNIAVGKRKLNQSNYDYVKL